MSLIHVDILKAQVYPSIEGISVITGLVKMKKFTILTVLLALMPSVAFASWANAPIYRFGTYMLHDIKQYPAKEANWIEDTFHSKQIIMREAKIANLRTAITTYMEAKQQEIYWLHTHPGIQGTATHTALLQHYIRKESFYQKKDNEHFHPTRRSYTQFVVKAIAYEYPHRNDYNTRAELEEAVIKRMSVEDRDIAMTRKDSKNFKIHFKNQ